MVLLLKQWKSRSSPGFATGVSKSPFAMFQCRCRLVRAAAFLFQDFGPADVGAGWSSPVARQAHNLKVAGSNPAPATSTTCPPSSGLFVAWILAPANVPNPTLTHFG